MLRILHTSDLHLTRGGRRRLLERLAHDDYDVWCDTGDLLPNVVSSAAIHDWHGGQRRHQARWIQLSALARRVAESLGGRPALCVQGNHDFIDFGLRLRAAGAQAHSIAPGVVAEVQGVRFAGFSGVPYIDGRWWDEIDEVEFARRVSVTLSLEPDVLLTHPPPRGVLDGVGLGGDVHIGVGALADQLEAGPPWRLHLFGHVHETGGQRATRAGVQHVNGACHAAVIAIDTGR